MRRTLFTDIGGVLLTNGWERRSREKAAELFELDSKEMDERHQLTFYLYETGKMTLDEYVDNLVFNQPRSFTHDAFKQFMFEQSLPYPEMLTMMKAVKDQYNLNIVAISNEGRELCEYRIENYLTEIIDFYVVSGFVHVRKPDKAIFELALDLTNVQPEDALYIEDRPFFVEVAAKLGFRALHHESVAATHHVISSFFH